MHSPGNARKPQIWPVSLSQNSAKITKITRPWPRTNQFWRWSRYISMQNFRPFPPCVPLRNARKPQIWHVSLSQNSAKITKINRPCPRTNQFWRWSRYISVQNFRPFPPCVLKEMPGNPKFDTFHKVKIAPKLEKSTDWGHKLISSESGQDTSACKISGHFLHAFSGKRPEPPNLTRFTKSK